jgi:hypothetical protein
MFLCIFPLGEKMVLVLIHTVECAFNAGYDCAFVTMPLVNAWEFFVIEEVRVEGV